MGFTDKLEFLEGKIHNLEYEVVKLQLLIKHMWIHSGYIDNGITQMSEEQKELYNEIILTDIEYLVQDLERLEQ